MKVLIIEDNKELCDSIREYLSEEGYICEWCTTLFEAEDKLLSFQYDCILLDIMLPDGTGLSLLEFLKKREIKCNVLIISAKNALDDKIAGLGLGADDYITKPFHLAELNARLKAVYRRNVLGGDHVISYNGLTVDTISMEVKLNDIPIELTRKEYDLLLYFLTNKNKVLTKQTIAEHLWGDYMEDLANFDFVYQHVKNLRKKINLNDVDYISTVYGLGYKFNAI